MNSLLWHNICSNIIDETTHNNHGFRNPLDKCEGRKFEYQCEQQKATWKSTHQTYTNIVNINIESTNNIWSV